VLRVNTIADLFYMAEALSKQPRPKGPRLAVVTNAGGPGVLAADSIIAAGGELAEISAATMDQLNQLLPPHWSRSNPVDILGDALPDKYAKVMEIVAADTSNDGLLAINCPQGMSHPTLTAERLVPFAKGLGKPVLACWMGGAEMTAGIELMNRAGIPTFPYPDTASRIFYYMWRYSYLLRGLYETPVLPHGAEGPDRARADAIVEAVRQSGRTLLTEVESKELLACYGIPTAPTLEAHSAEEAVAKAEELGFPVVVKLLSHTITHKTEVDGVKLNLSSAAAVRNAWSDIEASVREKAGAEHFLGVTVQPFFRAEGYELILGSTTDAQFGPVLLFGTGGQLVEVFRDQALSLPPLNTTLARRFMEQTKIFQALQGIRGRKAIDLGALQELMVRFSQLVVEQRWIKEIDINPLLASPDRLTALDARVIVYPKEVTQEQLPRLAIRPYPKQYVRPGKMKNGEDVVVRPIRPEDEPLLIKLHQALSERTVYLRYFQPLKLSQRTAHERLTRICFIDYDREMALVVEHKKEDGNPEIIAIGRLSRVRGRDDAEMAVLVDDRFQHLGLGTELYQRLIEVARDEHMTSVVSTILSENHEMQAICRKLGFLLEANMEDGTIEAVLKL
jgi:acetyltransferase